jgi:hypothetical protein
MIIMNNKIVFSVIIALFLFAAPILAVDFDVSVDYPTEIYAGMTGTINVDLENSGDPGWFSFSIFGSNEVMNWFSRATPTVKIESGETKTVEIEMNPPFDSKSAKYAYSLIIRKGSGETSKTSLVTYLRQKTTLAVIDDFSLSCSKCNDNVRVSMVVENVGSTAISDLKGIIEFGNIKKMVVFDEISSNGKMTKSVDFEIETTQPGNYNIDVVLYHNNKETQTAQANFEIPIDREIQVDRDVSHTPIGAFVTIKALNGGNAMDKAMIDDVIGDDWWVAYLGPNPDQKDGTGWTWFATLLPSESEEVSYVLFYWPVPILIVLFIASAILGHAHLTGAHVYKEAYRHGDEIGVSIRVKNMGGKLEGAVVRDTVPFEFKLPKHFTTLKPILRKTGHGTELVWRIGNINSGEERVLHYKMIPRDKSHKTLKLPVSSVRGKRGEKTIISVSKSAGYLEIGHKDGQLKFDVAE